MALARLSLVVRNPIRKYHGVDPAQVSLTKVTSAFRILSFSSLTWDLCSQSCFASRHYLITHTVSPHFTLDPTLEQRLSCAHRLQRLRRHVEGRLFEAIELSSKLSGNSHEALNAHPVELQRTNCHCCTAPNLLAF